MPLKFNMLVGIPSSLPPRAPFKVLSVGFNEFEAVNINLTWKVYKPKSQVALP